MIFIGIAALGVVFAVLVVLFARNLLRARRVGEIYSRNILIRRVESPINFWITVVGYSAATIFAVVAASFSVLYALTGGSLLGE